MAMWGKFKESGIWLSPVKRRKILFRNHDSLFIAFGRVRLRLMKP